MFTKYRIAEDKNTVLKKHDEIIKNSKLLIMYTNDSAINDKVETTTVVLSLRIERNLLMRNDIKITVYAVELHDLVLITFIAAQYLEHRISLIIFTDNQTAITSFSESNI